jgi:hypothetical protein
MPGTVEELVVPKRVFLSSTFTDLSDYRVTVQNAIRQLGAVDVSMEHFGARDERPADECIRLVQKESDLFVGIYAHRYGYVPDGSDISISEMEYKAASESDLPRFIYVLDDDCPWRPALIDTGDKGEKLRAFKGGLFKRHICQTFESPDQLATKVVADVGRHIAMQGATRVGPGIPVQDIGLESLRGPIVEASDEWNNRRRAIYATNRNIFLAHVIRPSSKPGQKFEVFIFLVRHPSQGFPKDFSDVRFAEFFLGPYWESKVFPAIERNGFIGLSTSAYGTFLCLCRVTFTDGTHADLHRYIDFEAQRTGGAGN